MIWLRLKEAFPRSLQHGFALVQALLIVTAAFGADARPAGAGVELWKESGAAIVGRGLRLDLPALHARLAAGGMVALPMPDGSFQTFRVDESPVMEPALVARFPEIRTWRAQGIDDPTASGRLDVTPMGFHAYILREAGSFYIDPVPGEPAAYVSVGRDQLRSADPRSQAAFRCDTAAPPEAPETFLRRNLAGRSPLSSGETLRTYRIAIAATAEYTTAAGGSVLAGLAAITTTLNRVNAIYERELAIHLSIVSGDDQLVFTDPGNEPYLNNDLNQLITQNQATVDTKIGSANYDIGHVFSTANAGTAARGVGLALRGVCQSALKAQGASGAPTASGDAFDVDVVAHEIAHQFGAHHTFNSTNVSCGGGARNAATAYEPGSGSTIMSFAGLCGATANLQPLTDDYFNGASYDEIEAYATTSGDACAAKTSTGNNAPLVSAGPPYTIPIGTPFALTAAGVDPDSGDSLTFCWEEADAGAASPPEGDDGTRAIFRSFRPVASPVRTFPQLSDILSNTQTFGEVKPSTTRSMNFRVAARDNKAGGGGVSFGTTSVNVVASAGPFVVTQPNAGSSWSLASKYQVVWNVANTTSAPVSCANVNISLSTDGGHAFTYTLASNVPNNGSAQILSPALSPSTTVNTARVKVACAGNVFFHISVGDFSMQLGPPTADFTFIPGALAGQPVQFTDASTGLPTSYDWDFNDGTPHSNNPSVSHTFDAAGTYQVSLTVRNAAGSNTKTQTVVIGTGVTPPVANFTFTPANPTAGQTISFTDTSTNSPTTWSWSFGDSTTSTSQNPTKSYTAAGSYQVGLTVSNAGGPSTKTQTVVVAPSGAGPVANFTFTPANPTAGQNISFSDTSSGSPTAWSWTFGDSTTSTSQNPTKSYTAAGSYQVGLTVSNTSGTSSKTQTIIVAAPASGVPVADFSWSPNPAIMGQPVLFTDLSAGAPTSWSWTFGDTTSSTSRNPTHTFNSPGQFDVDLVATNAQGPSKRKEQTVTVLPPVSVVTKVLPIVLDAAGVGGVRFGTEITLANRGTTSVNLTLTYTSAPSLGNAGSGTVTETLGPLRQIVIPDGIAYLRGKGLAIPSGAASQGGTLRIVFMGVSSADVAYAGARTTAPVANGRAGFGYAAVRPEDGLTGKAFLFGLRENAADRSNIALVNLSPTGNVTLRVTIASGAGDSQTVVLPDVSLGPLGWAQLNRVLQGTGFPSGYATIDIVSGAGPYFVYGVFNDNATSDGSYVLPVPGSPPNELQLVPVLVETGTFQSELVLSNPFGQTATVTLSYVESLTPSSGAGGVAAESLKAFEQKIIPNALQYLRGKGVAVGPFGGNYAGSLAVVFTRAGVTSYGFAGARTAAPGDGGQYGFFGRALGVSESAAGEAWVFGLQQNALNRSNVAVSSLGDAGTGVSLKAEVYDGDKGQLVFTSDPFPLAAGGWTQFSSALAPLGVANGFVHFIRVSGGDHITAYGVVNDGATPGSGATNDGSYIPFSNR